MTRRAPKEGALYRMTDGRWRGALDLGWQDGKRVRKVVTAKTQALALAKLREAQRQLDQGVAPDGRMTVELWVRHWLHHVVTGRVGPNTLSNYTTLCERHIIPALGKTLLSKVSPEQIDHFLSAKAGAGLGRSTVARLRTLLADALTHAERRGYVSRNVAQLAVMPRTEPPTERQSLTPAQAGALVEAARGERLEALIVVAGSCGLRPGEATGLLWADLDLDAATLTVSGAMKRVAKATGGYQVARGAPKRSRNGLRTIALPPSAVSALKAHRARQAAERLIAGPLWVDCGLVFPTEVGTPLDPSNLRHAFARIARRAGLEGAKLIPYALRHTAVSLALDLGASIEETADMLGDDPRTLYRHYRHKTRAVATAGLRLESVFGSQAVATGQAD
jgi:integrase